ncbi:DUF3800 domain-containing protein [Kitasatospora sp. NPDC059722]|uniref:DUF3800 domain-containing protein n=1 Tax=Kitasatospora sp. NPDC059722 TaxID=3346925 RepID=UPI00368F6E71
MREDQRRAAATRRQVLIARWAAPHQVRAAGEALDAYRASGQRLAEARRDGDLPAAHESLAQQVAAQEQLGELIGLRAAARLLDAADRPAEPVTVFVDETTVRAQHVQRAGLGTLQAYGAVALPGELLSVFAARAAGIRADFGLGDEELKWSPDRKRQPAQFALGAQGREPMQRALLAAAAECGAWTATVVWDEERDPSPAAHREKWLLKLLYERISMGLSDRDGLGTVIFDQKHSLRGHDAGWLAATRKLTDHGTEYTSASRIVNRFVMGPSDHLPGLQLADLVVGATTALVAGQKSGLALREPLLELIHRREDGDLSGAGLKLWPNSLENLYSWIQHDRPAEPGGDLRELMQLLGEDHYDAVLDRRPFARDDGLTERH